MELPFLPENLGIALRELPLQRPDFGLVARVLGRLLPQLGLEVRNQGAEDLDVAAVGDRGGGGRHDDDGFGLGLGGRRTRRNGGLSYYRLVLR